MTPGSQSKRQHSPLLINLESTGTLPTLGKSNDLVSLDSQSLCHGPKYVYRHELPNTATMFPKPGLTEDERLTRTRPRRTVLRKEDPPIP